MSALLAGLGLGLSLIVAIGAQNAFVLRQGIRRERVLLVAAICAASDAVLILAGITGIGAATAALPWLVDAVRWAGAAFLVGYGLLAARRALRTTGAALRPSDPATGTTVALTCLALTWLNPHVYLDTVFLLGSVGAGYGDQRWLFAAGAMLGSAAWFGSLAYGARYLGRWLGSAAAWRVLDGVIAVVMVGLGISLVL